jgi:hypothetical protein
MSRWYLSDLPSAGCGEPTGTGTEGRVSENGMNNSLQKS